MNDGIKSYSFVKILTLKLIFYCRKHSIDTNDTENGVM